jgi:hypothetical protein
MMGWEAFDGERWFPVKDVRMKMESSGETATYSVSVDFIPTPSLANAPMEPEKRVVGEGDTVDLEATVLSMAPEEYGGLGR